MDPARLWSRRKRWLQKVIKVSSHSTVCDVPMPKLKKSGCEVRLCYLLWSSLMVTIKGDANNGSRLEAPKILTIEKPDAMQMNRDLMQAFHEALEKDPAADLLSVVGATYMRAHRRAQYQELSEAGRYNLRTINSLYDEVIAHPEIDLHGRFPSDYPRRYRWAMPRKHENAKALQQPEKPRDWVREKLDAIDTANILYPLSDQALTLPRKYSETNSNSYEASLAASLKALILHSEMLFELRIRGVVVKCSDEIVVKVFPDSRDLTEYHNLQYLAEHAGDLPIPKPHGLVMLGNLRAMFMSYIPGVTLDKGWLSLSHEAKLSLQKELDLIFSQLRSFRQDDGPVLGGQDLNTSTYAVTGIIDWEDSGFYPDYYEYTTLSNGQSIVTDDDWYLYVPDCISPLRFPNLGLLAADEGIPCDIFE
ncbi:hypothetical protein I7I51_01595 [Histoplasma capsulatum]|uniref:Aminoglycoside phosphotransferase domain-containing protein n=1 Tax=Ajellomyces capsulatus TaxID=5037 RepID=A0A8A1MKA7_AJECA|nr:predicted protein [Histoplasma mississippiense (nom. inval.)]EDN10421.1 predicted protein [Histoplasma mississippiense (nom. inval.)]QSS64527.1 hypothetical protein I7I51_01595 [Histoplasma capsulatum]